MFAVKIWKDNHQPPDPRNNVMISERISEHETQSMPRYEVIVTENGAVHTGVAFKTTIEAAVEAAGEEAEMCGIDTTVYIKMV